MFSSHLQVANYVINVTQDYDIMNGGTKMSALIRLEIRKNLKDAGLWFWTFVLPIIFTVLFISILTTDAEDVEKSAMILSIVPGYIVMFMFFIIITMVDTFMKDLNIGMTARLASTPLSSASYLVGKWVPYMIIVFIQLVVLFVFGKIVYDVPIHQPFILLLVSIFLTFTVTGIGLAVALLVKTFNMGLVITQLLALGGAVLSGLWVPIEFMPSVIQTMSQFLPQYWAHQGMQKAMDGTLMTGEFIQILSVLLAFGLIGFIIALIRYPQFLKRAKS